MDLETNNFNVSQIFLMNIGLQQSNFPPQVNRVQPTHMVGTHQVLQQLRVAEAEVDELKQSLRYVEIQLAKAQEEKETMGQRLKKTDGDMERQNE